MMNKYPFPALSMRNETVVARFGSRLADLRQTHPSRVQRALRDYETNFWPSQGCPVFRGFYFAPAAKRVIGLLKALDVPMIRIVSFAAPDSVTAAKWETLLQWPREQMTFRHPPNGSSPAARKWIAIDALFPAGGTVDGKQYKAAQGFSLIVRIVGLIASIEQRRVKASRLKHPDRRDQQRDVPGENPRPPSAPE